MDSNKTFNIENRNLNEEIVEMDMKTTIRKFEEIIQKSKEQKTKEQKIMKEKKKFSSHLRGKRMPIELINEFFASLPLEDAFTLLAKMANALLASNVQKMFNGIKMTMKTNKWDPKFYGHNLNISEEGLIVKHSGPEGQNCIRSVMPIPETIHLKVKKPPIVFGENWTRSIISTFPVKFSLNANIKTSNAFYYEVEICKKNRQFSISIGFIGLNHQNQINYDYDGWLGYMPNSIGMAHKRGIRINDDTESFLARFENGNSDFDEGDVIGLGKIKCPLNSSMQCFATCNHKLLGKAKLPPNFTKLQIFPATNLYDAGDTIRVNFGKEEWCFRQFHQVFAY